MTTLADELVGAWPSRAGSTRSGGSLALGLGLGLPAGTGTGTQRREGALAAASCELVGATGVGAPGGNPKRAGSTRRGGILATGARAETNGSATTGAAVAASEPRRGLGRGLSGGSLSPATSIDTAGVSGAAVFADVVAGGVLRAGATAEVAVVVSGAEEGLVAAAGVVAGTPWTVAGASFAGDSFGGSGGRPSSAGSTRRAGRPCACAPWPASESSARRPTCRYR